MSGSQLISAGRRARARMRAGQNFYYATTQYQFRPQPRCYMVCEPGFPIFQQQSRELDRRSVSIGPGGTHEQGLVPSAVGTTIRRITFPTSLTLSAVRDYTGGGQGRNLNIVITSPGTAEIHDARPFRGGGYYSAVLSNPGGTGVSGTVRLFS